jgi:NAD(P)-dependent dehydrogenase (short-subunit alcohol dehydrogenase family)
LKGSTKKVITISSAFADDNFTTGYAIDVAGPYTISKAAMNTAVAKYSAEYAESGVLFMGIAPGAVEVGQDKDRNANPPGHPPWSIVLKPVQ